MRQYPPGAQFFQFDGNPQDALIPEPELPNAWEAAYNSAMQLRMAFPAEGNKVVLAIGPRVAAELLVMHLQVGHHTATLTTPTVSPQHGLSELRVFACA